MFACGVQGGRIELGRGRAELLGEVRVADMNGDGAGRRAGGPGRNVFNGVFEEVEAGRTSYLFGSTGSTRMESVKGDE